MENRKYLAYLHHLWLTQVDLRRLCSEEGRDARVLYELLSEESLETLGIDTEKRYKILERLKKFRAEKIDKVIKEREVSVILDWDDEYPASLREIPHSPYLLYVRWNIPQNDMFAVVGSRSITGYWKSVIAHIVPKLAQIFSIVSWGALGCDTEAHKQALESWWNTIVVIGTGIDKDYPSKHTLFFSEVVQKWGCILSIFPIWEEAMPYNFPIRNEIVVGLSRGVLVIEAKEKSGSLITAGLCLDMWRDLFSIPWEIIRPTSRGCNMLIRDWAAKCVMDAQDIFDEYDVLLKKNTHKSQLPLLSEKELLVYHLIAEEELESESLGQKLYMSPSELMMQVSMLELKWLIKKQLSGKYRLV